MKRPSESHFSDGLLSFISAVTGIKDKNTITMELNPIIEKIIALCVKWTPNEVSTVSLRKSMSFSTYWKESYNSNYYFRRIFRIYYSTNYSSSCSRTLIGQSEQVKTLSKKEQNLIIEKSNKDDKR